MVNEVGVVGSTILRQYSELEDFAGADIEQLKFKKTYKSTKAYEFVRTDGSKSYLPFSTPRKGWKRCKVISSSRLECTQTLVFILYKIFAAIS